MHIGLCSASFAAACRRRVGGAWRARVYRGREEEEEERHDRFSDAATAECAPARVTVRRLRWQCSRARAVAS